MGRSVDYLRNANKVSYFDWPLYEDGGYCDDVIGDIQVTIKEAFPEFSNSRRWDSRETRIILEGYGCEIGIAEYCGLATLSIRIDEWLGSEEIEKTAQWIDDNWEGISKCWNKYNKIGSFSNGEVILEAK